MMFAQLGAIKFNGLSSFVSYSTTEEIVLAEFALIGRKPRLMGAGVGLVTLNLSITLHASFCNVSDEISSLQTSMESFEILPLLWGNGKKAGEWVIKEMPVEFVNMDKFGNIYDAKVNLTLLESVEDNKQLQAQQAAANKAFATGDKQPATKSKRVNPTSCQKSISNLVNEIRQYGDVINKVIPVYTGDHSQASLVRRACDTIRENCNTINTTIKTSGSCVYNNTDLLSWSNSVLISAGTLGTDITINSNVLGGAQYSGDVPDGNKIFSDNTNLQTAINGLVSSAGSVFKSAIIQ
jgi:GpU protein